LHEVLEEGDEEFSDLSGGTLIGEILGELDESFSKMGDWGDSFEVGVELLEVSLGFLDLNERSTVDETVDEFLALSDGVFGGIVIDDELFVGGLSLVSLPGGFGDGGFSIVDELFVSGDEGLESSSLWVEGVLEMGRSDTESDLGVSESLVDLVLELVVLGFGPSVFFLFTTKFKVKVSNKVLEGGDELVHWASSL